MDCNSNSANPATPGASWRCKLRLKRALQREEGACLRAVDGNDNILRSKERPAQRTLFFSAKTVHNTPNTPQGRGIGV